MLDRLNLPTLQQRREIDRLVNMFKIVGGMVLAINADEYFIHQRAKRHIKASQFENFQLLHRNSTVARRVTNVTSEHYGDP